MVSSAAYALFLIASMACVRWSLRTRSFWSSIMRTSFMLMYLPAEFIFGVSDIWLHVLELEHDEYKQLAMVRRFQLGPD